MGYKGTCMEPDYPAGALPLFGKQVEEKCKGENWGKCKKFCNHKPYDPRPRDLVRDGMTSCNWFEKEKLTKMIKIADRMNMTNIADAEGMNKLLDEEELEEEEQEEQDEKKHYLIEVEDEKVDDELDDEGHGKDLNRVM